MVNARYEAYQMRVQGRNYNTNVVERQLQGTNASLALGKMMVPEVTVFISIFLSMKKMKIFSKAPNHTDADHTYEFMLKEISIFRVKVLRHNRIEVKKENTMKLKRKTNKLMMKSDFGKTVLRIDITNLSLTYCQKIWHLEIT